MATKAINKETVMFYIVVFLSPEILKFVLISLALPASPDKF